MIYCPYTNQYYNASETSSEHIIPMSLGGVNGFEIPVERKFNTLIGSVIDGKLANNEFILFNRIPNNAVGHSKKIPKYISKKAKIENYKNPVRLEINNKDNGGIKLWDNIEKKELKFDSSVSFNFTTNMQELKIIQLRFVAKVALATGLFLFKDKFIDNVNHHDLRKIMNFSGNFEDPEIKKIKAKVDHQFNDQRMNYCHFFKYTTEILEKASSVGVIPTKNTLIIFVGILSTYIGMVEVDCNVKKLPTESISEGGLFICLQNKQIIIKTWNYVLKKLREKYEKDISV